MLQLNLWKKSLRVFIDLCINFIKDFLKLRLILFEILDAKKN